MTLSPTVKRSSCARRADRCGHLRTPAGGDGRGICSTTSGGRWIDNKGVPLGRTMTVDFYRVEMPKESGSTAGFELLLKQVHESPADGSRYERVFKAPVALRVLHISKHLYEGEMVRMRMDAEATRGDIT